MNTDSPAPSLRMIDAILGDVETFFAESGCPLTGEQAVALAAARRTIAVQIEQVAVARCACGKPLDHIDADADSDEWACWAPDPDHRPAFTREAGWTCSCGLALGADWGTPAQWHAQHLAEHVTPPTTPGGAQ